MNKITPLSKVLLLLLFIVVYNSILIANDLPQDLDLAINAMIMETTDRDSAVRHWTSIYESLDTEADQKYKGDVALILSKAYNPHRVSDSILIWKEEAKKIYESIGNERGLAEVLFQDAYHAFCFKDYESATASTLEGISIMERLNDDYGIALGYLRLSRIFHFTYKLEESASYGALAGDRFDQLGDHVNAQDSWSFAGHAYRVMQDSLQSLTSFENALSAAQQLGIKQLAGKSMKDLGFFHMEFNNIESSEEYFLQALNNLNSEDSRNIMLCNIGLSQVYLKAGRYEECIITAKTALKEVYRVNDVFFLSEVPEYIAKSYEQLGQYDSAYVYMNLNWQYSDSLFFKEQDESMKEMTVKYETERKDLLIQRQKRERYYGIGLIGLLSLLGFSGWKYNRKKLKFAQILQENIKEREAMKTRLYTNMTHEFRTPLTVIMGVNNELFDTTKELNLPSNQKQKFLESQQLIHRNSQNLLNLVNQLLDISKSDSQMLELQLIQADIISYLNYLTESFYSQAHEKNIRLVFYSELPSLIMDYDEQKVQHIAYNLLSNAIKFTQENGKIIMHASKIDTASGSALQLRVKDDGIGIAENHLPHIFDRFYQVDDSSTRHYDGSGIGLSLTKDLVELMQGDITMESVIHEGTTCTIIIPITNQAEKADYTVSARKMTADEIYSADDNIEIEEADITDDRPILLIVEDNKDVASYLKLVLSHSYHIISAADGEEGIQKAIETVPDLIISDVMMPKKNGYELTKVMKQDKTTSHIPIILLTAKASHDDKVEGLSIGADAYLTKPFEKQELLIRINKLIESRIALRQHYALSDLQEAQSETQVIESPVIASEEAFFSQIQAVIQADLHDEKLNAETISRQIGISQSQLYRKVKALTGLTIKSYIRDYRLQRSITLLKTTDKDIAEIAYEVGFASPSYFSKSFHKVYKKSPLAFRKVETEL